MFKESSFFSAYKYYIQIEIAGEDEDIFNKWFGLVESRIRHFVSLLEKTKGVTPHIFPKSYTPVRTIEEDSYNYDH